MPKFTLIMKMVRVAMLRIWEKSRFEWKFM